jgi:hypothetical protein
MCDVLKGLTKVWERWVYLPNASVLMPLAFNEVM